MIIDSHVHIGGPPQAAEPHKFAELMDKAKIDKAIVFRYFYNQPTAVSNRYIQGVMTKDPEHYIGFAWIDPNDKGSIDEIETAVNDWRLKGLKLHLEMNPAPLDRLREVFKTAERFSIPICIHLGDDFSSIDKLSREFSVKIIIAHLGTGVYCLNIERLKKAIDLAKNENIYLETSGNTYPFVDYTVRAVGAAKIIFGSDFPHEHPLVIAKVVQLLEISNSDKALILEKNIRKILNI